MTNRCMESTKIDWIRRIVVLLRGASSRQLRDIYFLVKGYLGPDFRVEDAGEGGQEVARETVS